MTEAPFGDILLPPAVRHLTKSIEWASYIRGRKPVNFMPLYGSRKDLV